MPSCEGKSARKSAINTEVSSCTSKASSANHRQAVLLAAAPGSNPTLYILHYATYDCLYQLCNFRNFKTIYFSDENLFRVIL